MKLTFEKIVNWNQHIFYRFILIKYFFMEIKIFNFFMEVVLKFCLKTLNWLKGLSMIQVARYFESSYAKLLSAGFQLLLELHLCDAFIKKGALSVNN